MERRLQQGPGQKTEEQLITDQGHPENPTLFWLLLLIAVRLLSGDL